MKRKNKKVLTIVLASLVLLGILYYAFGVQNTAIGSGYPIQIQFTNWSGSEVKLTADYFGTISSSQSFEPYTHKISVCGSNDVKYVNTIVNNYNVNGNVLKLESSTSTYQRGCGNYLKAVVTLPAGTIKLNCTLRGSGDLIDDGADAKAKCQINDLEINHAYFGNVRETSSTKSEVVIISFNESTEFNILLEDVIRSGQRGGSASANLELIYTPAPIIVSPPTQNYTANVNTTNSNITIEDDSTDDVEDTPIENVIEEVLFPDDKPNYGLFAIIAAVIILFIVILYASFRKR